MKITSIRYARPDDPIYAGGLQMSFQRYPLYTCEAIHRLNGNY